MSDLPCVCIRYEVPKDLNLIMTREYKLTKQEVEKGQKLKVGFKNNWIHVFRCFSKEALSENVKWQIVFLVPEHRVISIESEGEIDIG